MSLDLDAYLALPRLSGLLRAGPGGPVVHCARPDREGTAFATTVVAVGVGGVRPLTGGRPGLAAVGADPSGDLLLLDRRPDPDAEPEPGADEVAALWRLPAAGGEARFVAGTPAGVDGARVAADTGTVVLTTAVFRAAADLAADRRLATARREAGTSALWFDGYPVRHWDAHLGQRAPRLLVVEDGALRDLTGDVGWALRDAAWDLAPDGRTVVTTWETRADGVARHRDLVAVDVATGERRVLAHDPEHEYGEVVCAPDGRWVAVTRSLVEAPDRPTRVELWLVALDGSGARRLARGFEHWPQDLAWTPDGGALLFVADEAGRAPLWRLDPAEGAEPVRLGADGAFAEPVPGEDGVVHALRSRIGTPPEVVAVGPDGSVRVVHAPAVPAEPWSGRVEEVAATAEDGTALRAWLVLPEAASEPSPLVVVLHGGPVGSWNAWQWRWQPQLFAARGYAVLLPDPALSTGYGPAMLARGWHQWGGAPYTDVLALTNAAVARADVDGERTAVAGGSYGGYLTNWVVGSTDRFRAAVSHASLWDLSAFRGVTDDLAAWERWFGDPEEAASTYWHWSPSRLADRITTPTLVVHGERDYRVPVGEGLAVFAELQRRGVPSALLYLPDEGHWVQRPGNVRVWYDAVLAWLDTHVLGAPWRRPELL